MVTPQRKWIQLIGLLLTLLWAFSPMPAASVAAAITQEGSLADTAIHLPDQIGKPSRLATPPQKAFDLLQQLEERQGAPLPGYVGGREFQNRERRLPRGRYREYDVNRKIPGRGRDAERIVIEQGTGKAYYTGDHYRTFIPLN